MGNNAGRGEPNYCEKTLCLCHFFHHASYIDLPGNASGKRMEQLGIYGRIILNSILEKWNGEVFGWIQLSQETFNPLAPEFSFKF
jgi:hypothetical protein